MHKCVTLAAAACLVVFAASTVSARPIVWPTFTIAAPSAPVIPAVVDPTTAVNPTKVEFTPSSDHDAVSPLDGTALVTRYELRIYLQSQQAVVVVAQDLAKPTPGLSGVIDAAIDPAGTIAKLAKDTLYVAKVAAIGPRGEGVSVFSNPFGYAGVNPPGAPGTAVIKVQ